MVSMMKRKMPSIKQIVDAQELIWSYHPRDHCDPPGESCWACGGWREGFLHPHMLAKTRQGESGQKGIERAHIHARGRGGSDSPDNFFLLCPLCHAEQEVLPYNDKYLQVMWLYTHESAYHAFCTRIKNTFGMLTFYQLLSVLPSKYADKIKLKGKDWERLEGIMMSEFPIPSDESLVDPKICLDKLVELDVLREPEYVL
jgi:hypothetical protein